MPDFQDKVRFENVTALNATAGGGLWVRIDGRRLCIPQSQIDDSSEVWKPGDEGELVISQWIAEQKELV